MSGARDVRHAKPEQELKVGSRALIRAAGGTDGSAETVGSRQQRMSDCGLTGTRDFLRIDEVAKLEDVTVGSVGHPHVTRVLAKRQGYELFKVPSSSLTLQAELLTLMAQQAKEHGDATATMCAALADGKVDADEAERALVDVEDELRLTLSVRAALLAIVHEAGGGEVTR